MKIASLVLLAIAVVSADELRPPLGKGLEELDFHKVDSFVLSIRHEQSYAENGWTGGVARDLGLAGGTPCLEVTRRTEVAGDWVTLVAQTYPGDRHELVAEFAPRVDSRAPGARPDQLAGPAAEPDSEPASDPASDPGA